MNNSKDVKAKMFASRIPVIKRAVKPSNELVGNKKTAKIDNATKYSSTRHIAKEGGRLQTQTTSQNENRKPPSINANNAHNRRLTVTVQSRNTKTAESLSNKRCTNISAKTINKKPAAVLAVTNIDRRLTNAGGQNRYKKNYQNSLSNCIPTKSVSQMPAAQSINKNKKVDTVRNQSNNKKSTCIEQSNVNRRITNFDTKLKEPMHSNRNIVNRRLSKVEIKRPVDIAAPIKKQSRTGKQQKTICNSKEIKVEKDQSTDFSQSKHFDMKPRKDISLNQGPSLSTTGQINSKAKANDDSNLNHLSQPDIEFVADEKYRQQILSGKELTPNLKPLNKVKFSSIYERQSLYKSSQTPFDINTALKRLEEEGRRISMMKINGAHPNVLVTPAQYERQSLYKSSRRPFDINAALKRLEDEGRRISVMKMSAPSSSQLHVKNQPQSILKSIENVNQASENRKASAMKSNPLHVESPRLKRDHINERSASAFETVLRRLEELQMKKKAKSSKKVTFNLEPSDSSHKVVKSEKSLVSALKQTDDQEKNHCFPSKVYPKTPVSKPHSSAELPSSPDEVSRDVTASHYNAMLLRICGHPAAGKVNHLQIKTPNQEIQSDVCPDKQPPVSILKSTSIKDFTSPSTPTLKASENESSNLPSTPTLKACARDTAVTSSSQVQKRSISSAISQSFKPDFKTYNNRLTNSSYVSSALRSSFYLPGSQAIVETGLRRNTLSRLCTPKPISFFPRVNANNDISPEFMGRRTSCIVATAPISTPMVLRNLAESFEESPSPVAQNRISDVCQRLDFDEIDVCQRLDFDKIDACQRLDFDEIDACQRLDFDEIDACQRLDFDEINACQRLDFDEIDACQRWELEKEAENSATPQNCESSRDLQKRPVQKIVTCINIMDQLTDRECCQISESETYSVIFERRLLNPIAQILSHGDDMHFVPLKIT